METLSRVGVALFAGALLFSCAPMPSSSGSRATPSATIAPGVYTYQPAPLIWQLVTITDGEVANGAGAVFEWNCTGQRWTIGTIRASVSGAELRFGDDRFMIGDGRLDARWQQGVDPRGLPKPRCPSATPMTRTIPSADAAARRRADPLSSRPYVGTARRAAEADRHIGATGQAAFAAR